ncbi:ATP-dependent RNA helicase mtr4, partial [Dictyocoela roeselum]
RHFSSKTFNLLRSSARTFKASAPSSTVGTTKPAYSPPLATIPNAIEFAQWITAVHGQTVHVVYTEKRPIPLIHYVTAVGGHGLVKVQDGAGEFNLQAFSGLQKEISRRRVNEEDIKNVLDAMVSKDCLPIIIFSFARRDCEKFALALNNEDFSNEDERDMIETIFNNALSSLRKEDRNIPLIQQILPMLKRGVGIHHSGLLPIIKEIVEILFQEGLLKVLFATETFSIGLNMPARSVVFTSLSKFDGQNTRLISSGEYTQMSGRAGRRGIDMQGIVVSILSDNINPMDVRQVFCGEADVLNSAFHLSYNMIINL